MRKLRPNLTNLASNSQQRIFSDLFNFFQQASMYSKRLGCGESWANSYISHNRHPKLSPQIGQNTGLHWMKLLSALVNALRSSKLPPNISQGQNTPTYCIMDNFEAFQPPIWVPNGLVCPKNQPYWEKSFRAPPGHPGNHY